MSAETASQVSKRPTSRGHDDRSGAGDTCPGVRPREHIHKLLSELFGPGVIEQELNHCELDLVGPCLMAQMTCQHELPGAQFLQSMDAESFSDHCAEFMLAGVKSMRAKPTRRKR
jgi:hypothetical protein